ncbi:SpoIIE family protein phosphatase [Frisingicoccus sp.]|uniref:SpoIIE family protein phosphatase n=1 Tax=Frisingicoccus sp. TaxID=1918627 RepID=UPI003AB466FA
MKRIHIRQWMVLLLSGFLQHSVSGLMNPMGIAYFAAAYMWPEHRSLLPVISLIGMAAGIPQTMLLKYLGILIGIMLITYILEWKKAWVSQQEMLLMLSLLILSADVGYGLAREGVSIEAAGRLLRFGAVEAIFGAVGFAIFYSIMKVFLKDNVREVPVSEKESEENFVRCRLGDMASSFRKLSHMLTNEIPEKEGLSEGEVAQAFSEVTETMCAACGRREHCWEKEYYDTCHSAYNLLHMFSENGQVDRKQVPAGFRRRCINIDGFLKETNRVMQMASVNLRWQNRLNENRLAFAGQMGEIAEIMDDLSMELSERKENSKQLSDILIHKLEKKRLKIKKISVTDEGSHGRRQKVYLIARVRRGRCMTVKELAELVSAAAGLRFVPEKDSPEVVGRKYTVFELVEDTKYRLIQGVARKPKEGEPVNGDSYAFIYLDSGQVLMSLSDGMGSGEKAKEESELMINLLEQMVDTGFARRSALRMINSVMMFHGDRQLFSSMDLSVVDLYSGICEFIKIGASSTFIKRGEKVECVTSGSLPMGVFPEMDCEGFCRNLFDGDVIVMVTDGVVNRFSHGNEAICDLLSEMDLTNPNAMASEILNEALDCPGEVQQDDMTVLVCTVCKKPAAVL